MTQTSFDKDNIRFSRSALVDELSTAGARNLGRRYICCPFHDDSTPSAEIKQASSGAYYFYCHRCSIADDVWALRARIEGRDVGDVLREERNNAPTMLQTVQNLPTPRTDNKNVTTVKENGLAVPNFASVDDIIASYRRRLPQIVIEGRYEYTNPDTKKVELCVIRYRETPSSKKKFLQATPLGAGWVNKGITGKTPLYNRLRVRNASRVLIVEGEKIVHAGTKLKIPDLAFTTFPGGAQNAGKGDYLPLVGKECYVWADNDEPGSVYADTVIAELKKLDCSIYRVRINELGLQEGEDAADYITACGSTEDAASSIELVLMDAEPAVAEPLKDRFDQIGSGKYRCVHFLTMPKLSLLTQALLPGTVTLIFAAGGKGKSLITLENGWRWFEAGESVKLLMLEDDDDFHQTRALAQMSGQADLLNNDFVRDNIEWAQDLRRQYAPRLSAFSRHLEATGSVPRSLEDIATWVESVDARIKIIDPITAAQAPANRFTEDLKVLMRIKLSAERTGSSIILVSHEKGGKAGQQGLSGAAGGEAYPRFCQCVLWLRGYPDMQDGVVEKGYSRENIEYSKTIEIRKARNGRGEGKNIAVSLNPDNVCFEELGVLVNK